jgi:hypothetical protein
MIKFLQIIASIIVFTVLPTVVLDYYSKSGFLDKFMVEQSLSLMGTILAIYIAAASSFIAILATHEDRQEKNIFDKTTKELKQSIIFIFLVFVLHFFLLVATPAASELSISKEVIILLKSLKTFTFMLYIYALFELSSELFTLKSKLDKKTK